MTVILGLQAGLTLLVQVDQVHRAEVILLPEAHQVAQEAIHLREALVAHVATLLLEVVRLVVEVILPLEVHLPHPDLRVEVDHLAPAAEVHLQDLAEAEIKT